MSEQAPGAQPSLFGDPAPARDIRRGAEPAAPPTAPLDTASVSAPRIADELPCEVLAAAIAGKNLISVSIRIAGGFTRPGTRAVVEPTIIVVAIPATITPA